MNKCHCGHKFDDHNVIVQDPIVGPRIHSCVGQWEDQGMPIPCYCSQFVEKTPEWEAEQAERYRNNYIPRPTLWNKILKFIFR
jgi:hypothetical protein